MYQCVTEQTEFNAICSTDKNNKWYHLRFDFPKKKVALLAALGL